MAFAERLKVRGKPSIVIVGAVMTKLLHIIHGTLEHGRPFNPNTTKMRKSPVDFNAVSGSFDAKFGDFGKYRNHCR
jgi:hypothetical protein